AHTTPPTQTPAQTPGASQVRWALHYLIAPEIEVDDDLTSARGTWYLWMPFTSAADSGLQAAWIAGRYDETYRREPAGWRIHRLNANIQIMSPYEEGWARHR
ncbi:MAG: nuclear transport factor 2 family protein, partial [Actinomycetia bacterium]|nr:nuclear transport factor 2 family protein [Actinomycetes bacterium]